MTYTLSDFEEDVAFFNKACGNKNYTKEDSLEDVCNGVTHQYKIIQEELNELQHSAATLNEQELKDAVVDVLFTSLRLVSMLEGRYNIMAGCMVVADNNSLKYTMNHDLSTQWAQQLQEDGVDCRVEGTTINEWRFGKMLEAPYYCVKNHNGKVLKWKGFPKVNLNVMDKV